VKFGVQYYTDDLGNIFCGELDQSNMVGGTTEGERNANFWNAGRLERVRQVTGKHSPKVMDYGCGHGLMARYFGENGVVCVAYDKYVEGSTLSDENDCVTMIEVIEHLSAPFSELSEVYDSLREGGVVMIETSFSDWINEHDPYVNPNIGHSTIFSHAGLDHLMTTFRFRPGNHMNRNVRIYIK
jgi:2-polyprenyl-3-methyl-5-hydroxy-6-metoxy-1,4-benzoquinol methylase